MLIILTTTIRVKNKYNANIILIIFVGKLYNLIMDKNVSSVSGGLCNLNHGEQGAEYDQSLNG